MHIITIVTIFLLALSFAPIVMVLVKMKRVKNFKQNSITVNATITHVETRRGFKGSVHYLLNIEYKPVAGSQLYKASCIEFKKHLPGAPLPLMYMPDNPALFSTDFGKRLPYMLGICIVFFLLIAGFCIWLNSLPFSVS